MVEGQPDRLSPPMLDRFSPQTMIPGAAANRQPGVIE